MTSQNQLPTIRSYGEYHGQNYGLNCLMVSFSSGLILYYSYETIVAFSTAKLGLLVRSNEWSTTTGKHLNWIDGGDRKNRLQSNQFEALLTDTLKQYGLIEQKCQCGAPLFGMVRVHHHNEDGKDLANPEHIHEWIRTHAGDTDERLYRCESCNATLNSDGGVI